MNEVVVALDVGGTNTRIRIARVAGDGVVASAADDLTARVGSATELYGFIAEGVKTAHALGTLSAAVVAAAGPVTAGKTDMTNWSSDARITLDGLVSAGLPRHKTLLVNDMVAGVWGALAQVENGSARSLPENRGDNRELAEGNLLYLAPGTGLGAAGLVRHRQGPLGASAVSCESQHTAAARFGGTLGRVSEVLAGALGREPSWEEIVSGRGLAHIYDALSASSSDEKALASDPGEDRAGLIARAAREGDSKAIESVMLFYEALGRFAQMLALSYLPCAAIVLGGTSTEHNLDFVKRGPFLQTLVEHPKFHTLLESIPVFTAGGETNLEGGVRLAAFRP